jgi:hypothetical protein
MLGGVSNAKIGQRTHFPGQTVFFVTPQKSVWPVTNLGPGANGP